jgi:hypothetical protein
LSATGANGDQAGDLIPDDGRTFIQSGTVNGKQVQFIEHTSLGSSIGSSNVFQFSYRAPADASFGSIRFNVAGNAANGNGANTGDFIYATEVSVSAFAPSPERQFVMTTRGGFSMSSSGATSSLAVGFGRMLTTSGSSGGALSFISYRQANVLVTEPGFAASVPIRAGRIYTEVGAGLNTGIALANPNSQAATVSIYFTDAGGVNFGDSSVTIPANSQLAGYLNAAPFASSGLFVRPVTDARTFTFTSNVPVSVMAVRTRINERSDFMMAALPVADVTVTSIGATSIAHFADGAAWSTEVVLVNSGDALQTGTLQFLSPSGQGVNVTLNGQANTQFPYSIPARSSVRFRTAGVAASTATGWIEIVPSGGTSTPSALGVLIAKANNVTSSETSVVAASMGNAFRVHAERLGNFANRESGSTQSGLAIANPSTVGVTVTVEATNLDGSVIGSASIPIPARGQVSPLLSDIPAVGIQAPFTGILWITAPSGASVSVTGLRARYNERPTPDLLVTAFPAVDESASLPAEAIFPQVVDSGGYSTRFLGLGARTTASSGTLRFGSQSGQPLQLDIH